MTKDARVLEAIYAAVDEINQQLAGKKQLEKSRDTVLFGNAGGLDSLALVNLIVAAEQRIGEEFGVAITLADERAMSRKSSPFRTIGTLAEYVSLLLEEHSDG